MKIWNLGPFTITLWWWVKADKRQKRPTNGIGFIVERK